MACRSRSIAALLGERFKFVRADNLEGFKAGALRLALVHTAADAEVIGMIDADYVVHPDWLKDLVPLFARSRRSAWCRRRRIIATATAAPMHHAMNGEYAGFFDIGMVQRNEVNAIVVHGTMCLIRRSALEAAGGWSSDTICEDTDLGLTMLELGYARALHQQALRPWPAARQLRRLQEAARPLGLWRLADHEEALAPLPARRAAA